MRRHTSSERRGHPGRTGRTTKGNSPRLGCVDSSGYFTIEVRYTWYIYYTRCLGVIPVSSANNTRRFVSSFFFSIINLFFFRPGGKLGSLLTISDASAAIGDRQDDSAFSERLASSRLAACCSVRRACFVPACAMTASQQEINFGWNFDQMMSSRSLDQA